MVKVHWFRGTKAYYRQSRFYPRGRTKVTVFDGLSDFIYAYLMQ